MSSGHIWTGFFVGFSTLEWEVSFAVNLVREICFEHFKPLTFVRDRVAIDCITQKHCSRLNAFLERTAE